MRRSLLACAAVVGGLFVSAVCADAVSINVGSASGAAGTQVQIPVTLSTAGMAVAGTSNTITADPATPFVACTVNPAFAGFSAAILLPQGCTPGVDCLQARGLIIRFPPLPIPDGATLYTCDVSIAADAPPQSYPIKCLAPSASDPNGKALPAQCVDGRAQVGFLECDVVPFAGDNAGEFGDGSIDIFDVRAVFAAAQLGADVPAPGSARFSAMDAAPVDTPPICGGDGTLDIFDGRQCFAVGQLGTTNYARTDPGPTCTSAAQTR
jgi:hypothetical protein